MCSYFLQNFLIACWDDWLPIGVACGVYCSISRTLTGSTRSCPHKNDLFKDIACRVWCVRWRTYAALNFGVELWAAHFGVVANASVIANKHAWLIPLNICIFFKYFSNNFQDLKVPRKSIQIRTQRERISYKHFNTWLGICHISYN